MRKVLLLLYLICHFFGLFSQPGDIKIVKTDYGKFPEISIFVKTEEHPDSLNLTITENDIKLDYKTTPVSVKDINRNNKILFLIPEKASDKIIKILIGAIKKIKKTDKINIGIFYPEKNGKKSVFFLSPEFSKNKAFFLSYLKNKKINETKPDESNCFFGKETFKYLTKQDKDFENTGIFIVSESETFDFNFCFDITDNFKIPVYFLQTTPQEKKSENEIIDFCTKARGMYSFAKNKKEAISEVERFIEDISFFSETMNPDFYKLTFILKTQNDYSEIVLNQKNRKISLPVKKPESRIFSKKELFLTIFSSGLFLTVILLLIFCRKGKREKQESGISSASVSKPIEINVKGKGFNKTYFFEKQLISIGRDKNNDIVIPDLTVSGNHAVISKEGNDFYIRDLGSTNGVIANKKRVKKYKLKHKDTIKLGGSVIFFRG